jgi:hypothetical protein
MPFCQRCREEVDEVKKVKVGRRAQKLCEDCADEVQEEEQIAAEAEGVMRDMMEYRGR